MNCKRIPNSIVCGSFKKKAPPCGWCVRAGVNLCDHVVDPKALKTCDAPICDNHAQDRGSNRHLCPDHAI